MRLFKRSGREGVISPEEKVLISRCVSKGDVVFDVGAHHGDWSLAVLRQTDVELHAFEANRQAAEQYSHRVEGYHSLNRCAVSFASGETTFFTYKNDERLSSIHRRKSVEAKLLPDGFVEETLPCVSLDDYWFHTDRQIGLLKIDVEGAEYDVLHGAYKLLSHGRIDYLQFEYGGTFRDAGTTLRSVWAYLRRMNYHVFLINGKRFTEIRDWREAAESFQYMNLLAVHQRLVDLFVGRKVDLSLFTDVLARYGISIRGAVHVGAHKGEETKEYFKVGAEKVVLLEANPKLALELQGKFQGDSRVSVIHSAVGAEDGNIELNIASMDQSSSILPLGRHSELYPKIKYVDKVAVPMRSLDSIMTEMLQDGDGLNFLALDIQGAELLALKGAQNFIERIDAIQTEVNFTSLYSGGALLAELDQFLLSKGFVRVHTCTPYSPEWGDALYIKRPFLSMSCLGKMGRFGNQIFQYMFGLVYCRQHQLEFCSPRWDGNAIFKGVLTRDVPHAPFHNVAQSGYSFQDCSILNSPTVFANDDIEGFFQYHTRVYRSMKDELLKHFAFSGVALECSKEVERAFGNSQLPVVAIHLRRTDYGTGIYFIAPNEWYVNLLRSLRERIGPFRVYIATDDRACIGNDFDEFEVINLDCVNDSSGIPYLKDFIALTLADHVAISNSSFSFAATLLNTKASSFWRPNLAEKVLVQYEPWDAEPLLRDETAEAHGETYMSDRARSRTKYRLRKKVLWLLGRS